MIIIDIIIMYTFKEIRDTLPHISSSPSRIDVSSSLSILDVSSRPSILDVSSSLSILDISPSLSRIDVPSNPSRIDVPPSPSILCKENEHVLDESRDESLRYEYYRGIFYRRAIYQDDLSKMNIIQIENCKLYNFKRSRSNSNDYLPESKRQKKMPRCIFSKRLSKKEDISDI